MMHILGKWLFGGARGDARGVFGAGDIGSVFLRRAYRGRAFGCCQCNHQADIGRSYFANHDSHARTFSLSLSTGSFWGLASFVKGFSVSGFWVAVLGALIVSVVSYLGEKVFLNND